MSENGILPARERHTRPEASPRWFRRLGASPGVIDTAAAGRVYARTAGWALQRIARAGDLLARYASAAGAIPRRDLLLVHPLAVAAGGPGPDDAERASGVAQAGGDRSAPGGRLADGVYHGPSAAPSLPTPPALALRLHRRMAPTAAGSLQRLPALGRVGATLSLRPGLHTRLAARGDALPQPATAAITLARRPEQTLPGKDVGHFGAGAARAARAGEATPAAGRLPAETMPAAGTAGPSIIARKAMEASAGPAAGPESLAQTPVEPVGSHAIDPSADDQTPSPAAVPETSAASPGIIDTAAAQRVYARTTYAGDRVARTTSAGGGGAQGDLLLHAPVLSAAAPSESDPGDGTRASRVAHAEGDRSSPRVRSGEGDQRPAAAPWPAMPSSMAQRLQRRIAGTGVVDRQQGPPALGGVETNLSLRPELHTRLAARGEAMPPLGRRPDQTLYGKDAKRFESRMAKAGDPTPGATTTGVSVIARKPIDAPAAPTAGPESPAQTSVATVARRPETAPIARPGSPQRSGSLPRTPEVLPRASHAGGGETALHLARALRSDAQPGQASPIQAFGAATASDWVPGTEALSTALPAGAGPLAAPSTLARMPDDGAAPVAEGSAAYAGLPGAAAGGMASTAEIPAAAAPPTLIWRATAHAAANPGSGRFPGVGHDALLMRSGTATDTASSPAPAPYAAAPGSGGAESWIGTSPASPDLNLLAEQVTRIVVRRLEAERERRGAKRWI